MEQLTKSAAPPPRTVDAGRGVSWWGEAWTLFMRNPAMWLVMGVLLMVILGVLGFIPALGPLISLLFAPVFAGAWLMAARKLESGGELEVGDLFAVFKDKDKLTPLLVLGALLLAAILVVSIIVGTLGMGAGMSAMMGMGGSGPPSISSVAAVMGVGLFAMLLFMAMGVAAGLAMWFAPALVVFHQASPVDALKISLSASLKNVVAMVLYGALYLVAAMLASIPLGLGWIVLFPLVLLSMYVSYLDIFGGPVRSAGDDQLVVD